jgi:medium-chain acyl-[acyl-carrier-protein] hydrolase
MSKLRLFCFPYGGAGASWYRSWSRSLPDHVEIVPVNFPGRENRFRETPHTEIVPLLTELLTTLDFISGPFAFFGHSLGALVAFALTRELREAKKPLPRLLIVSGYPAPQLFRDRPHVGKLPHDEFVEMLRKHFDVTDELLDNPILAEMALPVLRADLSVVESYAYRDEPPLDLPMVAFGGAGDPEASEEQIRGWQAQSTRPVPVRIFPGGHFYINSDRQAVLDEVALALRGLQNG